MASLFVRLDGKRGVRSAECGVRSVENDEYGKCGVCGNASETLTDLFISKHFNAFIQHKKGLEIFYS